MLAHFLVPQSAHAASAHSITQYGITYTFTSSHEYGQYANGDYWVVGPVTLSALSPDFDGTHNGWEVNPLTIRTQGFDSRITTFDASLVPSLPYTAQPGASVIKSISVDHTDLLCKPCLRTATVLTIVAATPPNNGADLFRPGYFGNDKTVYSYNDVQYAKLPATLDPAKYPIKPSLSDIEGWYSRVQLDHIYDWIGRKLHPVENMPDYGAEIANRTAQTANRLMMSETEAEKKQALINYIQYGIDIFNIADGGGGWPSNGGHGLGRKLPLVLTSILLNNQAMKDLASEIDPRGAIFHENGIISYSAKADSGRGKVLWGQATTEASYWQVAVTGDGFRTAIDPYGYIDGGAIPGGSYQFCCNSNPWRGTAMAGLLMPEIRTVWNDENFYNYVDRWINFGAWAQNDPCAPVPDGVTTWPNPPGYGVTFGPDGNGDCVRDTDPTDGIGRHPLTHGTNANKGDYGTRFYDFLVNYSWNTLFNQSPINETQTILPQHGFSLSIPNPCIRGKNGIRIYHTTSTEPITFTVFNNTGSLLYTEQAASITWHGQNQQGVLVPPGVYILQVTQGTQRVSQKIMMVE